MLERYFVKPETVDRVRGSWIGEAIETYVQWLTQKGYANRTIHKRVPLLMQFGEFAHERGATGWEDLSSHIAAFAEKWGREHGRRCRSNAARSKVVEEARNPIEQMLQLVVNDFASTRPRTVLEPFSGNVPGFFTYLFEERGLSAATIRLYRCNLRFFEMYLRRIKLYELGDLSPVILSSFVTERCRSLARTSSRVHCSALRVFLGYLFREQLIGSDLSTAVESVKDYRLSDVPRSISWQEVRKLLEVVDRRTVVGKRDYAILLLLVTYGLRAREVAALTLDNIDWDKERLFVPERKAGHSTAFPLSPIVGDALVEYLKHGRPESTDRYLFFCVLPPRRPVTHATVSMRTTHYLRKAGISVGRPGSHTLRHTCIQRLVDAGIALKIVGDYVGHSSPHSTQIYTKTAIEPLRSVAVAGESII